MKLQTATSANVIDRRKGIAGAAAVGLVATVLALFGIHRAATAPDPDAKLVEIVSTAIDRGQDFWRGRVDGYRVAKVVLFDETTTSACGRALASSGPFYCPGDERIYVDLGFLRAIDGDLARAYVIAHELGHHIEKMRGELAASRPSTDIELGADCYAGAWMADEQKHGNLEAGDISGALAEASAVGDDKICPTCSPEQWTHGGADQRVAAVSYGIEHEGCP